MKTTLEEKASEAILEAMRSIQNMDERGPLIYNTEELAEAIHVLQSFLKQHVLHRMYPEDWSDWWEKIENDN